MSRERENSGQCAQISRDCDPELASFPEELRGLPLLKWDDDTLAAAGFDDNPAWFLGMFGSRAVADSDPVWPIGRGP